MSIPPSKFTIISTVSNKWVKVLHTYIGLKDLSYHATIIIFSNFYDNINGASLFRLLLSYQVYPRNEACFEAQLTFSEVRRSQEVLSDIGTRCKPMIKNIQPPKHR